MTITEYKYAATTVLALMAAEIAMASVNCGSADVTRAQDLTITSAGSNRRSPGPRSIRWIAGRDLSTAGSVRTDKAPCEDGLRRREKAWIAEEGTST